MQTHNLKRAHKNKKDRMVGRGGKHAKTSGRGGKGQTARAGNKRRPALRDIIKKLPKNRGYRFNSVRKNVVLKREKVTKMGAQRAGGQTDRQKTSYKDIRKKLKIKGRKIIVK